MLKKNRNSVCILKGIRVAVINVHKTYTFSVEYFLSVIK